MKQLSLAGLLVAVLFTVILAPLSGQSGNSYDPWLDYNDDGMIDANDLRILAQSHGTSGNPTRSVYVTNFPLDEDGNLKVSFVDQGIFAEPLILRGTVTRLTETAASTTTQCLLIDNHTPFPKTLPQTYIEVYRVNPPTYWEAEYDRRFIYENLPAMAYCIQGTILAGLKYGLWQTGGSVGIEARGFFYLERIFANDTAETVAVANMNEAILTQDTNPFEAGFALTINTPVWINQGERLAVRFRIEARNTGSGGAFWFRHYFSLYEASNDFLVIIPVGA
jgi:hypothetical protein